MSDFGIRASRAQNAPTVLLQGRVSPETRQVFKDAAKASGVSGVSVAYYLDAIAGRFKDQNGSLPLVQPGLPLRVANVPLVLLQGRVLPETRQMFKDAAAASGPSGVSVSYYLDALASQLTSGNSAMPLVEDPRRFNRVELPIPAA